ncbi:UNVERIFIED_CONTAM: hypothetical protein FKN15_037613 [Acipenser sinensis]
MERLKQAVESLKLSAQKERAESEQILSELIRSVERIRTEVGELIGAKEKAAVSWADEQTKQLEQEIQELRKRKAEMEQLSETEDHIHFLQVRPRLMKMHRMVDVTLDPDTAQSSLILSKDGMHVRHGDKQQALSDNPRRFDSKVFVLGKAGFTSGRHYWEVEVGEKICWRLGVTGESSQRKGNVTVNPQQSFWTVLRDDESNDFCAATDPVTPLPKNLKPRKLGVYLDYEGRQLSFYNVETRSLIYTFTDTFTEKLYPLFSPGLYYSGLEQQYASPSQTTLSLSCIYAIPFVTECKKRKSEPITFEEDEVKSIKLEPHLYARPTKPAPGVSSETGPSEACAQDSSIPEDSEQDETALFMMSLQARLKRLPPVKRSIAMIDIQTILHQHEFNSS